MSSNSPSKPTQHDTETTLQKIIKQSINQSNAGDHEGALAIVEKLLTNDADNPQLLLNQGVILKRLQRYEDSLSVYQKLLKTQPKNDALLSNMGSLFLAQWQLKHAFHYLKKALSINPNNANAHNNIGSCYLKQGKYQLAQQHYEKALACDNNNQEALFNLSWCLLRLGEFQRGFLYYEARLHKPQNRVNLSKIHSKPWQGQPLSAEQKLCICHEQGFGDTLQFIRFIDLFLAATQISLQQVYVLVQDSLVCLMQSSFADWQLISTQEPADSHFHIPLLSLPKILGLDPFNIPRQGHYLRVADTTTLQWQQRFELRHCRTKMHIGFAYQGSRTNNNDRLRSIPLQTFMPVFSGINAELHCLQNDAESIAAIQLWQQQNSDLQLHYHDNLHNFAETAALISNLDVVVSVDTAVAHLSAALGKPTLLLIAKVHDWRWFRGINTSPWYASVRLFRQQTGENWHAPLQRLNQSLLALIAQKSKPGK